MSKRILFLVLLFFACIEKIDAQHQNPDSVNKKLLKKIVIVESTAYTLAMVGLGSLWYQDGLEKDFKFFNDNQQWNGLDKIGHVFTAYQLTAANAQLLQKANIKQEKAYLYSALASSTMMLGIEVFDGFSKEYGASWGDLTANVIGSFLPFQALLWESDYIHPKYSFHPTSYAAIRPNTLGDQLSDQWLKDYNGQTYWLSTNFNIFSRNDYFPPWLAFSIGYGAEGMVYGNRQENENNGYQDSRQLYLSLDFDFSKIKTENKWLRAVLYGLNMLKVPFPTMSFSSEGVQFYPLYF